MKSWNSWLLSLGFAGWCLACAGCGGGDVPDPDADGSAAESAPTGPAEGPNPGPARAVAQKEPAAEPDGDAALAGAQANGAPKAKAEGEEAGKAAQPGAAEAADAAPPPVEGSSGAAQMLVLGNRPAPAATPEQGSSAGQPAGGSGPAMPPGGNPPGSPPGSEAANAALLGGPRPEMAARQQADDAAARAGSGAPLGADGYSGDARAEGGGLGGGDNGPADFRTPYGAVNAFLNALKAKNAEKLAEATARRAATEAASAKNQKLFSAILEQSLTEDDLNELANKLDGFTIEGNNTPKSTGKFTIILGKNADNGDYLRRTITARREKDGWKVLDISGQGVIDRPRGVGRRPAARTK